jgi:hypothetical protein
MLYFAIVWTALLVVCGVIGTGLLHLLNINAFNRLGDRLVVTEWLGTVSLSSSLLAVSLVAPVSTVNGLLVAAGLSGLALALPAVRSEISNRFQAITAPLLLGYGAIVIALSAVLTRPVTWLDTGLYHYGSIQWLAQYGSVTGVALIFNNLGFVSSWFALAAPLNPAVLEARGSAAMGGFVLLLALLQWLVCLLPILRGNAQPSDWFGITFLSLLLPLVLLFRLFSQILASPSPDMPVTVLVGVVAWVMVVVAQVTRSAQVSPLNPSSRDAAIVPLLVAVGAMTIKLTALPLVVISSCFYAVRQRQSIGQLGIGATLASLLLAPMLLAGIKTSSCPLYPSSTLCFDLPWMPSAEKIEEVEKGTHDWTTWFGSPPNGENPTLWLLRNWLESERSNIGIVLLLLLSIGAVAVSCKPLLKSSIRGRAWVLITEAFGVSFLLMTAPFLRFVLPYFLLLPALLAAAWGTRTAVLPQAASAPNRPLRFYFAPAPDSATPRSPFAKSQRWLTSSALAVIAVALTAILQRHTALNLLLPPPMQTVAVVEKQVNDITYFSPQTEGEVCWDAPLPCGFIIESDVQLRDPDRGIAAGFVRQSTTASEASD